jgi:predicted hotdog family 3-hydroxylacyl-ACP dehydratase
MGLTLPLAAEELIPHRLPMRLVDRLLEIDGKNGLVEALVSPECPLVATDDKLESIALIELIAQSYAALKGYLDRLSGAPVRQGFLVGVKKLRCLETVRVGQRLRIEIRTLAELDSFAVAEGKIWHDEKIVACGEIKVWID